MTPEAATDQRLQHEVHAACAWPEWAEPQLRHAVRLAGRIEARGQRIALAPELYRLWFNPSLGSQRLPPRTPLFGTYRTAHAGSAVHHRRDGLSTVARHDVIGHDGWWRTWSDSWQPVHSRGQTVRLIMSPRAEAIGEFVHVVTRALLAEDTPWLLACPTDPRRLRRMGCAVLHVRDASVVPAALVGALRPLLHPVTPPLCLPVSAGVGQADNPDNGMSFGEHRCHLVALALRNGRYPGAPLRSIAQVFAAHGIDPGRPHTTTG